MLRKISVIGYLSMVGGLIGLLFTRNVLSPSPLVILPQVVAVALMVWARITFGRRSYHLAANPTAGGVVDTGPYRFIRHPIYTAMIVFTTTGAAAHLSWTTVMLAALVWAGALSRMFCEEQLVAARYPEYKQYAARTRRMVPFVF